MMQNIALADIPLAAELRQAAAFRVGLRGFLRRTQQAAAAAGLTVQRYDLLLMVGAAEVERRPATVKALTEGLGLSQSAVTELVNRAEEVGLVRRRHTSADFRVTIVELTADGRERLLQAFTALHRDREQLAVGLRDLTRQLSDSDH